MRNELSKNSGFFYIENAPFIREEQMTRPSGKRFIWGLDVQFIIYFMLFAYAPLLVFSIVGYILNREIVQQMSANNLSMTAVTSAERMQDYFWFKKDCVLNSWRRAANCPAGMQKSPQKLFFEMIGNSIQFKGAAVVSGRQFLPIKNFPEELFAEIKDSLYAASPGMPLVKDSTYFMQYVLNDSLLFLGAVKLDEIRNRLHLSDENTSCVFLIGGYPKEIYRGRLAQWNADKDFIERSARVGPQSKVVVRNSTSYVYQTLTLFLKEILLANVIIGILMLIIAVIFSRRITRPIRSLVLATNKIGRGDLSQPVKIEAQKEIQILADEFESMRQKLLASYTNLEEKIEQRTTALREAQFQISHQEKMASLGLMAAGVAHEIGNPLTSISSMTQIIKRKTDDKQIANYLNTISVNIERISRIVREMVDFARPSNYETSMVNINEIINNAVSIVRYDKRSKNISFRHELSPDLPATFLVSDQLLQVFINILINAVDALPEEGGEISIRSFYKEDCLHIHFSDNGIGIPRENRSKIFEPFFTTKKVGKGTGLGLSVSYGIIKSLNGKIEVDSKMNEGSKFMVSIPVIQKESGG